MPAPKPMSPLPGRRELKMTIRLYGKAVEMLEELRRRMDGQINSRNGVATFAMTHGLRKLLAEFEAKDGRSL